MVLKVYVVVIVALPPPHMGLVGFCFDENNVVCDCKNQKPVAVVEAKSNRRRGIPAEFPGLGGGGGVEVKNENHRLWVALSRDEIEEDVFSMSGNRPSRRPRKRTKTLQKHLDVSISSRCST